jgi:putative phosphoribosyl transferase
MPATLSLPARAVGVVVLAYRSRDERPSAGDRAVARALAESGLGTALVDVLTPEEAAEETARGQPLHDVERFGHRVVEAIDWLDADALVADLPPILRELPLGCYGSGMSAAAVLLAAAARPHRVAAVVCAVDNLHLARDGMTRAGTPTLLIAGDVAASEQVTALSRDWFVQHLGAAR